MNTANRFASMIGECRSAFDRSRRDLLCRLGLRRRPTGDEDGVAGRLKPHYKILADRGRVVWGAVAQANKSIFAPGPQDAPGLTVSSIDEHYDENPHDLAAIGGACFQLKNTIPADTEFRSVAERLTDEFDQTVRMAVPPRLADGRDVFLGVTMLHRARLPDERLRASVFPLVIAPEFTEINMVLPLQYWSTELCEVWGALQQQLDQVPITSTAIQVAQNARKRPVDDSGPDWDTNAVPVYVTSAMAKVLVGQTTRRGLDALPMLSVGLSSSGERTAGIVQHHNPATEVVFVSNGIAVVVRKDQLEQLRGTVVDFKSSEFATGVVIRLPGE
jgi:hypothetical protein